MGVKLIAFPFRLNGAGRVVAQEDDTDAYYAGELAQIAATTRGERELCPDYGLIDPTFHMFDVAEFAEQVFLFGPPVRVEMINIVRGDGEHLVEVGFTSNDGSTDNQDEIE